MILFCRKCNKEIPQAKAIVFQNDFYCPLCKSWLSYFGKEVGQISPKRQLEEYDIKSPNAGKEKLRGRSALYSAPKVNTLVLECQDALKNNPHNTEALLCLAKLEKAEKNTKKALEYYLKILEIDQNHLAAKQALVEIYLQKKEYDKALLYASDSQRPEIEAYLKK